MVTPRSAGLSLLINYDGTSLYGKVASDSTKVGERHGFGPEADNRHGRMAEAIADCEALLCRGMGTGAYESMKTRNIRPVVTDIANIEEAVLAYLNGHIVDHVEKLH